MRRTPHARVPAAGYGQWHQRTRITEMSQMPAVSKDMTSQVKDFGVAEDRTEDLDGYTVSFVSIRQDHDLAGPLAGLPGGQCRCPHWGYVIKGSITVRYSD